MDTARAELQEETTTASDLIWELAERITEAPRDVQELFEEASDTFQEVGDTFQEVGELSRTFITPREMQEPMRRLGRATWQLEVVEARIEGRPASRSTPSSRRGSTTPPARRDPRPSARRRAGSAQPGACVTASARPAGGAPAEPGSGSASGSPPGRHASTFRTTSASRKLM